MTCTTKKTSKLLMIGFCIYQVIGLGLALAHPEIFVTVFFTTLEAMK